MIKKLLATYLMVIRRIFASAPFTHIARHGEIGDLMPPSIIIIGDPMAFSHYLVSF
jgi:hypothetical protein